MISFSQTDYYYYKGEKLYLDIHHQFVHITTVDSFNESSLNTFGVQPFTFQNLTETVNNTVYKTATLDFGVKLNQADYNTKIEALKNIEGVETVSPFYYKNNSEPRGTSNYFYVKLKPGTSFTQLETLCTTKNVEIIKNIDFMPQWYVLARTKNTFEDSSFKISSYFYETGLFDAIDPAIMFHFSMGETSNDCDITQSTNICVNDPDFNRQWGLYNEYFPEIDINACEAWSISTGENVVVGVFDGGIDSSHPDLANNIIEQYNCYNGPIDLTEGSHGTKVAGIIAAIQNNNQNISGIAPKASIVDVYYPFDVGSNWPGQSLDLVDGFDKLTNFYQVDVINCSWGDDGSSPFMHGPLLEQAIENALINGRNGLGIPVVFAAGNNGEVKYPAYIFEDITAVSSVLFEGSQMSSHGDQIDITAAGNGSVSTTTGGDDDCFSGTSAAAPHVTGVIAQMISVNDCLTAKQIRTIIESTAQKINPGEYSYQETPGRTNGTWNEFTGYGFVDAYASVLAAEGMYSSTQDLMIEDSLNDFGLEPNDATGNIMWQSTGIWVRNNPDEIEEHQNPTYDPDNPNNPNYVYVKVVNKSCEETTGTYELKLYWAKANTALTWPLHWEGNYIIDGVLMGDEVATISVPSLAPGEETIIEFEWTVPNPENYIDINDNPWHFCLLSRIVSDNDPMTFDELQIDTDGDGVNDRGNIWLNTKNNNNIAWKNTTVVEIIPDIPSPIGGVVAVANPYNQSKTYSLEFKKPNNETGKEIYKEAEVSFTMDDVLYNAWVQGNKSGVNFKDTKDEKTKIITSNNAILENLQFEPNEMGTLYVSFNFLIDEITYKDEFTYHVIQKHSNTNEIIGGETYIIKKPNNDSFTANAGEDNEIEKNESITLSAEIIDDPAIYNWYDNEGNLIYTGTDFMVSPEFTKTYQLEIINQISGFKDYDEVVVAIKPFRIESIYPNPANNILNINYITTDASSAYVTITGVNNNISNNYILDTGLSVININVESYTTGTYIVTLTCDGQVYNSINLLIN